MSAERLVELVIRSLTAEAEIASCDRTSTIYRDRIGLSVVDTDGDRWRLHIMREPWSAPA